MSSDQEPVYELPPSIDKTLLLGLVHDINHDASFMERVFHDMNERHHLLMRHIVLEANRQSGDDRMKQMSFINGALFVLATFKRQEDVTVLDALFTDNSVLPDDTTEDNI